MRALGLQHDAGIAGATAGGIPFLAREAPASSRAPDPGRRHPKLSARHHNPLCWLLLEDDVGAAEETVQADVVQRDRSEVLSGVST